MERAAESWSPLQRRAWIAAALLGVGAVLLLCWFAWQRVPYPYELEWMEGAMVDHAARVRAGLDVYVAPGPEYVPFLYTPLLYYLGALVATATGDGFLPLRLVGTLATAICVAITFAWVRRDTGRRDVAIAAAGLFCCGYGYLQSWYDLARNDTLMLAGVLGTAFLLHRGGRGAIAGAVVAATLAFLAKQTAVMWIPAVAVGTFLLDRRRGAWFGAGALLAIAGTVGLYHLATDGWFTFFVFEMPRAHGIQPDRRLGFFTDDLVPLLPMVAGSLWCCVQRWRDGRRGDGLFLAGFGGGGLVASYLSRLHAGGWENVMLYVFAAGCVLLPIAAASAVGRRARCAGLALVFAQFALLVFDPRALWQPRPALPLAPSRLLPPPQHAVAWRELVDWLRTTEGLAFVPFHGHVSAAAGKPAMAHAQAIFDLFQVVRGGRFHELADPVASAYLSARERKAVEGFFDRFFALAREQRLGVVVLDEKVGTETGHGPTFEAMFAFALQGFTRLEPGPVEHPRDTRPILGWLTNSPYVLVRKT